MHLFSRRNQTAFKRLLLILVIILAAGLLASVGLFFYLQRYLVYTQDGVYLDFNRDRIEEPGPDIQEDPTYDFSGAQIEEVELAVPGTEISSTVLSGYRVPHEMLRDPQALLAFCDSLDGPCTLLFDAKDSVGNFFFPSDVSGQGDQSGDLLSALVPVLKRRGFYLVARISAFRDRSYGLSNVSTGLPLVSGALWMDSGGCYWLDPANTSVQLRLVRMCTELFDLGFHEVVLGNFYFPNTDKIVYKAEEGRDAVVARAAADLSDALTGIGAVSFQITDNQTLFSPGSGRLYYEAEGASGLEGIFSQTDDLLEEPSAQLVFITDSHDTRFEGYGLLRTMQPE